MMKTLTTLALIIGLSQTALAHDPGEATYIANEGVMVVEGDAKILFDPLPLTGFGTYPEVPRKTRQQIMNGEAPFDNVDAIFISHAHRDHFDARAMNDLMSTEFGVQLVAPKQAIEMMQKDAEWQDSFMRRITVIDLAFGDQPLTMDLGDVEASVVRIPHSGWPDRSDVENMVYRVELSETAVVMHMGDADINADHYAPYQAHWDAKTTHLAFPPYWIYLYPEGEAILNSLNVDYAVGVHVPVRVPYELRVSGKDYFYQSGQTRKILPLTEDLEHETE